MACQSSTYHHVQHHGCQREIHANWPGQHHGFRAVIVPGRRCSDDRSSAAAAVEGVGVEGGEEDEYDGGDEGEDDGAADMAAELAVGVADLVPPGVRVALEPYPRHAAARAHRRGHHRRVEHIEQEEDEEGPGGGGRAPDEPQRAERRQQAVKARHAQRHQQVSTYIRGERDITKTKSQKPKG